MEIQTSSNTDNIASLSKKNSHLALTATVLVFMLTAGFTAGLIIFSNNLTISELNWIIVLDCVGFSLVAVLANRWSIIEIKRYLKGEEKEQGTCKYCSSKPAGPLLCSHCNSIMWDWINSRYTQTAVFIAQHRWSVLTGFLALFIIAPISLIFGLKVETEKRIDSLIERVEVHIREQNKLRTLIRNYECCDTFSRINHEKLNGIKALYQLNSWEYPMMIQEIGKLLDLPIKSNSMPPVGASGFEMAKFINQVVIEGKLELLGPGYTEKEGDTRWGYFIRAVYDTEKFPNDKNCIIDRKCTAFDLFTETKVQNLILRELVLQLQELEIDNDVNLTTLLEIFGKSDKLDTAQLSKIVIGNYPMSSTDKLMFMMLE